MPDKEEPTVESLSIEYEALKKLVKKLQRQLSKIAKHVEIPESKTERKQSGFAKPQAISADLAHFLEMPVDGLIARTEVTQKITEYIKKFDLQNPNNRREILPDDKLKSLLNPKEGDVITFFTLQRYMAPHYPKQAKKEEPTLSKDAVDVPAPPVPVPSAVKPKVVKKIIRRPVSAT
jgi:chromatin remodeling complex protein RSC6